MKYVRIDRCKDIMRWYSKYIGWVIPVKKYDQEEGAWLCIEPHGNINFIWEEDCSVIYAEEFEREQEDDDLPEREYVVNNWWESELELQRIEKFRREHKKDMLRAIEVSFGFVDSSIKKYEEPDLLCTPDSVHWFNKSTRKKVSIHKEIIYDNLYIISDKEGNRILGSSEFIIKNYYMTR